MPEIPGRLRPPRLSVAPAAPALGETYYNTTTNLLNFWNGTAWVALSPPLELWHEIGAAGEPAFLTSWANWGTPFETAGFLKDALGWVYVKGVIKSGTSGNVAFTLPAGYRPPKDIQFPIVAQGAFGSVAIQGGGSVIPTGNNASVFINLPPFRSS